jgi:hypothetical protein
MRWFSPGPGVGGDGTFNAVVGGLYDDGVSTYSGWASEPGGRVPTILYRYGTVREQLTSNRTYYVRTDGSDSNDGLTDSSGGAFLTIQHAVDVVSGLDHSIYKSTIYVRNGTYAGCGPVLFPDPKDLRRGGAVADILFESSKLTKRVEIKATGQQAFQYFGQKDIDAHFLVWLAFGEFFRKQAESPIKIYVLAEPGRVFPDPTKITLATFDRRAVGKLVRYQARLREALAIRRAVRFPDPRVTCE